MIPPGLELFTLALSVGLVASLVVLVWAFRG